MILKNCDFNTLFSKAKDGSIYLYGIGRFFDKILLDSNEFPWEKKLGGLIDASPEKQGEERMVKGVAHRIISLSDYFKKRRDGDVILIIARLYDEVVEMLNQYRELDETECYIYFFMRNLSFGEEIDFHRGEDFKIPPVIHYCWFGGKELPDLYKRCVDSWHKYCPTYQIIEWNESNCDLESNLYAKQAYEAGKYGFVPDYFRLKIIYEHGGIYLDTDVELIKNLDDLRHEEAFCGKQYPGEAALGLGFGAVKGNHVIKKLTRIYEETAFIKEDGTMNMRTSPSYQTEDLRKMGMGYSNRVQYIEGMCIYPTEVLSPINIYVGTMEITPNTYAIHHFDGSWTTQAHKDKKRVEFERAKKIAAMFS